MALGFELEDLCKDVQVIQQFPYGHRLPTTLPPDGPIQGAHNQMLVADDGRVALGEASSVYDSRRDHHLGLPKTFSL